MRSGLLLLLFWVFLLKLPQTKATNSLPLEFIRNVPNIYASQAAISHDASQIAVSMRNSISTNQDLYVYNLQNSEQIAHLEVGASNILDFVYAPQGNYLASGQLQGRAIIWSPPQLEPTTVFHSPMRSYGSRAVAFNGDGSQLAIAWMRGGIEIWNLASQTSINLVPTEERTDERVDKLIFSPDGHYMLSAGTRVLLWDTESWELVRNFDSVLGLILGADFSPDSRKIVVSSTFNLVRVYELETGAMTEIFRGSQSDRENPFRPSNPLFSGNGLYLFFAIDDEQSTNFPFLRKLRAYDAESLEFLAESEAEGQIDQLILAANGQQLYILTGGIEIWRIKN
jgi:WD40 repeat protein